MGVSEEWGEWWASTGATTWSRAPAQVADRGEAHAWNAEMLAEGGDIFHVKFIQRDDAIDVPRPGRVADGVNQALQRKLFWHGEDFIDAFEWPRGVAKFFDGQEEDAAAEHFASADKFLALFVGTDAENGERLAFRHATPPGSQMNRARIIQRPRVRDTEIAETARRAAPRPPRCARRLPHAHSASRARASSLFRRASRGIFRIGARSAGLHPCRFLPSCPVA